MPDPVDTCRCPATCDVKVTLFRADSDFTSLQGAIATGTIGVDGHE